MLLQQLEQQVHPAHHALSSLPSTHTEAGSQRWSAERAVEQSAGRLAADVVMFLHSSSTQNSTQTEPQLLPRQPMCYFTYVALQGH